MLKQIEAGRTRKSSAPMPEIVEEFDDSYLREREFEVLGVLSQHIAALTPQQLLRLETEGAVLIDLHALETGNHFGLADLTIAFVEPGESVADVKLRTGKAWISTFSWLNEEDTFDAVSELPSRVLCHQAVMMQTMDYEWFELVVWAAEERWISDGGEAEPNGPTT